MGRKPRSFVDGIYHVGSDGSDARYLFTSDEDRIAFLGRLGSIFERLEIGVVAYTLMGSHYHLVARVPDERMSRALQQLHTKYSAWHNRRHDRRAHLFRAHAFARIIGGVDDLLTVVRYVAQNPVTAGLAPTATAWRWSSVAATAGLRRRDIDLDLEPIRAAFADAPDWRRRYRDFVEATAEDAHRAPLLRWPRCA